MARVPVLWAGIAEASHEPECGGILHGAGSYFFSSEPSAFFSLMTSGEVAAAAAEDASASAATLVKVYADKPLVIVKLSPEEQLQIETADVLGIRFRDHDGLHWVKVGKFSKKHDRVILRFKERPIFLTSKLSHIPA